MDTKKLYIFLLILIINFSMNVSATEYQFRSTVDNIIPFGKKLKGLDLINGDVINGVIKLEQRDKSKYIHKGVYNWMFSVTKFSVNAPLDITFKGGHLTTNQTMEQISISYVQYRCDLQKLEVCGVLGSPIESINQNNSSVDSYSPVEFFLTQPNLKNADISFQEVVDLFLKNMIEDDTKAIIKFENKAKAGDYLRIILKIDEINEVDLEQGETPQT